MLDFAIIPPQEQHLLFALALYQAPLEQAKFLELFQIRKLGINATALKESIANLQTDGLVSLVTGQGYTLKKEAYVPVLAELQRSGGLASWIASMRKMLAERREYQRWQAFTPEFYQREMMFSAFAGEFDTFMQWREKSFNSDLEHKDLPVMGYFASDAGITLFASIPPRIQAFLLIDTFARCFWTLENCQAAYDYASREISTLQSTHSMIGEQLAWQAFLRGKYEQFHALVQHLPVQLQPEFDLGTALIKGDYAKAFAAGEVLLKALKAMLGKRKLFVPGTAGFLYTLCLLAQSDNANLKRAKEQVDDGVKHRYAYFYFTLQPLLNHLAQGVKLEPCDMGPPADDNFDALLTYLVLYWSDAPRSQMYQQRLQKMRSLALEKGYQWVAAEIDVLLHKQFGTELVMENWHESRNIKPLSTILQREETWKRVLTALAQIKSGNSNANTSSNSDSRIAWLLQSYHET